MYLVMGNNPLRYSSYWHADLGPRNSKQSLSTVYCFNLNIQYLIYLKIHVYDYVCLHDSGRIYFADFHHNLYNYMAPSGFIITS